MPNFETRYGNYQKTFENFLNQKISSQESYFSDYYFDQLKKLSFLQTALRINPDGQTHFNSTYFANYSEKLKKFFQSIKYSVLGEGKRFRPILCLSVAEIYGKDSSCVLPLALAVEMIHTYSLIHDDLPCMDDDDTRRGKPTNHKVYGESTALLAGDALLTEAFRVLSENSKNSQNTLKVIRLLTECAGTLGMIGGQYVDLTTQKNKVSLEELAQMQINKTGALMRASIVGSAILCDANSADIEQLEEFSIYLGLNFQITDDILDREKNELGSFVGLLGLEKSKKLLADLTQKSLDTLDSIENSNFLKELSLYNSKRLK
jgi:geranylgeranyl diphosphate synthase type II